MPSLPQLFISYSQKDQAFVKRLAEDLRHLNLGVWVDFWEIKVGDSLIERIEQGLRGADFVIAVLSQNSIESRWVKKELSLALHRSLSTGANIILPIKIEECPIPDSLQDLVYADFRSYEEGFETLLSTLYPEGLLQKQAEEIVRQAQELGHMLPEFFFENAVSAINKRLVPLTDTNYSILFWGGMESWFEQNLDEGITQLPKWSQFSFLIDFAADRFSLPETGEYSIPWQFISTSDKEAFDWDKLSLSDIAVKERALFGQGPNQRDIRVAHHAVIDFVIAVKLALQLGILREELAERIPEDVRQEISDARPEELVTKLLTPALIRMIFELSRTTGDGIYKAVRESAPSHLTTRPRDRYMVRRSDPAKGYRNANLINLLRLATKGDLSSRDFSNLNLYQADFSCTNLAQCDFRAADLRDANFAGCKLDRADWSGANITGVRGILRATYYTLCFSADNKFIFAGTTDGSVQCFDIEKESGQVIPAAHLKAVSALAWDSKTGRILSGSYDGTVRMSSVAQEIIPTLTDTLIDWSTMAWEKARLWWVLPHDYCIGHDEVVDTILHYLRKKHPRSLTCLAFSSRLNRIAFGTYGGILGLLSLSDQRLELPIMLSMNNYGKGHADTIWQVRFANQEPLLASAGALGDPHIKLWDLERRGLVNQFICRDEIDQFMDIVFSQDDKFIIGGNDGGLLCKWELNKSEPIMKVQAHRDSKLRSLSIDYAQNLLVTSDDKGWVKLWNPDNLSEMKSIKMHDGAIWSVQFSSDGTLLASAGEDARVAILNTDRKSPQFCSCIKMLEAKGQYHGLKIEELRADDQTFLQAATAELHKYGAASSGKN